MKLSQLSQLSQLLSKKRNWHKTRFFLTTIFIGITATAATSFNNNLSNHLNIEQQLNDIYKHIQYRQINTALWKVNKLITQYPNFRLAYTIKGDLLLSRSSSYLNKHEGKFPPNILKLSDFHQEATQRLKMYKIEMKQLNNVHQLPQNLINVAKNMEQVVIFDGSLSRLFVYKRDAENKKNWSLVADFFASQGRLGMGKSLNGDQKTPIGVYLLGKKLTQQLTDFYGAGALPTNYPNDFDKKQGKTGSGIWIHGTPKMMYNRPPKASDGCVVLSNDDMNQLFSLLNPQFLGHEKTAQTLFITGDKINWHSENSNNTAELSMTWQKKLNIVPKEMENYSIVQIPASETVFVMNQLGEQKIWQNNKFLEN